MTSPQSNISYKLLERDQIDFTKFSSYFKISKTSRQIHVLAISLFISIFFNFVFIFHLLPTIVTISYYCNTAHIYFFISFFSCFSYSPSLFLNTNISLFLCCPQLSELSASPHSPFHDPLLIFALFLGRSTKQTLFFFLLLSYICPFYFPFSRQFSEYPCYILCKGIRPPSTPPKKVS